MKKRNIQKISSHHSRRARLNNRARIIAKKKRKTSAMWLMFWIVFAGIIIWFGWKKNHSEVVEEIPKMNIADRIAESYVGEFKVARVIDGDTIEIEGGEKVRYIGIDTPEAVSSPKSAECFSQEATNKNKELVEGKMVRLEKDITDRDKYGRLLRYVYVGDIFVNLELIKEGYAKIQIHPEDVKYLKSIRKIQIEAKNSARGLWSACPEEK